MPTQRHVPPRIQALEDLERRNDLFAFRYDGWSAWRVMRNAVHRSAMALPIVAPPSSSPRRSLQALAATLRLLALLLFAQRRDVLVKTARSGLRLPLGEHFRDVYFDGLLERGMSHLKLEEINSPDFDQQAARARHPAALDPVAFTFWGRVLGTLFPAPVLPFCEQLAIWLAADVGIQVNPAWLRMRVSTVYWQARLYGLLLARVRPQAVLVSDTGEYALRIAAGRAGVRFIELQHGVFDDTHPDAIPDWVAGTPRELVLPDRLACRGTFWIEQLAATRQGLGLAVPVGNELIDDARRARAARPRDGRFRLVMTTQGLDSAALAAWTARLISAAPAALDWRLDLKLHPVYDAATHDYDVLAANSRVRVVRGAEQPNVFQMLAEADLHLSIASACHFDAAALGVPSAVVPLAGHEAMLPVADGVQIFVAHEPADVWRHARLGTPQPAGAERYAMPGFVDNLERLLT